MSVKRGPSLISSMCRLGSALCLLASALTCGAAPRTPSNWLSACQAEWAIEFECGQAFSEGLAAVAVPSALYDGSAWGFFNESGTVVISPKFSLVGSFSQGLAAVRQDDGWGFIDQRGNWVVAPQFVSLTSMNEQGFAFGVSTSGDLVRVSRDGSQRMLVPARFAPRLAGSGLSSRSAVPVSVLLPSKLWLLDEATEWALPESVVDVRPRQAGLTRVAVHLPGSDRHWGLLDLHGRWWAEPAALGTDEPPVTDGNLVAVQRKHQWQLVDRFGHVKNAQLWAALDPLSNGHWLAKRDGEGHAAVLDDSGRVIHEFSEHVHASEMARLGEMWLLPTDRELLVMGSHGVQWRVERRERRFEVIHDHLFLLPVQDAELGAAIDIRRPDGTPVLTPEVQSHLNDYEVRPIRQDPATENRPVGQPFALALLEPRIAKLSAAMLSSSGQIVTHPDWLEIRQAVELDAPWVVQVSSGKFGAIDQLGRWLVAPEWDGMTDFHGGLALGRKMSAGASQGVSLLDASGKMLDTPARVSQECAEWWATSLWCQDAKGHSALWLPTEARWIELGQIDQIHPSKQGLRFAKQAGRWGLIDARLGWRLPPTEIKRDDMTVLDRRVVWRTPGDNIVNGDRIYALGTGKLIRSEDRMQLERLSDDRYLLRSQRDGSLLIDGEGRVLLHAPTPYDYRHAVRDAVALVFGERYGLLNSDGVWVQEPRLQGLPPEWNAPSHPPSPSPLVAMTNGQLQWRNQSGKVIASMVQRDGRVLILDAKGRVSWQSRQKAGPSKRP
jgi:hypothetical protein